MGPDLLLDVAGDVSEGGLRVGEEGVGEGGVGDEEGGDAVAFGLAPGLEKGEEVVIKSVDVLGLVRRRGGGYGWGGGREGEV